MNAVAKLEEDELLTSGEAARFVGLSVETIRRLSDQGEISAYRTPTGRRLFRRSALVEMIVKRRGLSGATGPGRPRKTGTLLDVVPMNWEGDLFNDK